MIYEDRKQIVLYFMKNKIFSNITTYRKVIMFVCNYYTILIFEIITFLIKYVGMKS